MKNKKIKILHISDIHFLNKYEIFNEDSYSKMLVKMENPLLKLERVLVEVMKEKPDIVVISGDLTEHGNIDDYKELKSLISKYIIKTPLIVTLGNHDNKKNFKISWLEDRNPNDEPYNDVKLIGDFAFISFDSSKEYEDNGYISQSQIIWLNKKLNELKNKNIILITHHHLIKKQIDIPSVQYSKEFLKIIKNSSIRLILCGHTHHNFESYFAGKIYHTVVGMSFSGDKINDKVYFEDRYGYKIYELSEDRIIKAKSFVYYGNRNIGII